MLIEAEVEADAELVGAGDDAEVVDELGGGDGAVGAGEVGVIDVGVVEGEGGHVGERRVGFAPGEEELEAGEADGEFVDDAGGDDATPTDGGVVGGAEDFAAGRKPGRTWGRRVEGVAVEALLSP